MNISGVDLNLLLIFEALYEERSVSRAARRVGLTQPAVSNALARLRSVFEDELFVRTSRGITPTGRATLLAGPVRAGLAQFRVALGQPEPFDPGSSQRRFTIATTDYGELTVVAPLLQRLQTVAPGITLAVRRLDKIFLPPEEELSSGVYDAAISFFPEANALPAGVSVKTLFEEENVLLAGHTRAPLTLQEFAEQAHIAIFFRPDAPGLIDSLLAAHGLKRHIRLTTPHFLTVPYLVAGSDCIACVPAGVAVRCKDWPGLTVLPVPFPLPTFAMRLLWHQRTQHDPAQQWLRAQIAEAGCHTAAPCLVVSDERKQNP